MSSAARDAALALKRHSPRLRRIHFISQSENEICVPGSGVSIYRQNTRTMSRRVGVGVALQPSMFGLTALARQCDLPARTEPAIFTAARSAPVLQRRCLALYWRAVDQIEAIEGTVGAQVPDRPCCQPFGLPGCQCSLPVATERKFRTARPTICVR
jgi:hypothetical protein